MFGTPTVLLTIATLVLAAFVWILFEQNKEIRSGFEARLKAIEGLEVPFARKLADAGLAPLLCVLSLDIRLETQFSTQTLQFTPAELDEIRPADQLVALVRRFIEENQFWLLRQDTHPEVARRLHPVEPFNKGRPETVTDLYDGLSRADFWRFYLPRSTGEFLTPPELCLELESSAVKLSARWARRLSLTDALDTEGVILFSIPLLEGPAAEQYYCDDEFANAYPSM
jgi:hypothetical protein